MTTAAVIMEQVSPLLPTELVTATGRGGWTFGTIPSEKTESAKHTEVPADTVNLLPSRMILYGNEEHTRCKLVAQLG